APMRPSHESVKREPPVRLGVGRVERDCLLQKEKRLPRGLRRMLGQYSRTDAKIVGLYALRSIARRRHRQPADQRLDDFAGDLVLRREDILETSVEAFCP